MDYIKKILKTTKKKYILDNDIKGILKPFYVFQTILFARKYNIAKNCLTTVSRKDMSLTLVVNSCNVMAFYFATCFIFSSANNQTSAIFTCLKLVLQILNFLIVSTTNIVWSKKHLRLVLKLQNINRLLHNPNAEIVYLKRFGCIFMYTNLVTFITVAVAKLILDPMWDLGAVILFFYSETLYAELVYVIVVAFFLVLKIKRWNRFITVNMMHFEENANEEDEATFALMYQTFKELLDAYHLMGQLFGLKILLHVVNIFVRVMISLIITILQTKRACQYEGVTWGQYIGVGSAAGRAFFLLVVLCIACEAINNSIRDVKTNMATDLGQQKSTHARRLAKNVRRVCATRFRPLSACGVFAVDATLPLRLGALIATYTVVVLQFAFL